MGLEQALDDTLRQAIKDRDPARAERLIVEHVLRKKETVLAYLRSRGETRRNEKS